MEVISNDGDISIFAMAGINLWQVPPHAFFDDYDYEIPREILDVILQRMEVDINPITLEVDRFHISIPIIWYPGGGALIKRVPRKDDDPDLQGPHISFKDSFDSGTRNGMIIPRKRCGRIFVRVLNRRKRYIEPLLSETLSANHIYGRFGQPINPVLEVIFELYEALRYTYRTAKFNYLDNGFYKVTIEITVPSRYHLVS